MRIEADYLFLCGEGSSLSKISLRALPNPIPAQGHKIPEEKKYSEEKHKGPR